MQRREGLDEQLIGIMRDIPPLPKTGEGPEFSYVESRLLLPEIWNRLKRAGILLVTSVESAGREGMRTTVSTIHRFRQVDTGEERVMEGEGVGLSEGPGGAALAIAESTKRALMQNFLIVATDEAPELPLPVAHAGLTPQEVRREERLRRSRSNDVYGRILEASKQIRELPLSGVDDEVGMIYVPRDEVIAQVRKVLLAHDIVYNLVERTHKQSGVLTESWTTHVFQKPSPAPRKGARRRKKSEDELRIKWYSQAVDTMGPNGPAKATSLAQKHVFLSTFMIPTTLDPETQRAALSPPPPVERLDARQTLRRILSIMNRYRAQLDEEQLGEMFTQAGIDAPEHIQHLEQLTLEQRRALLQVLRRRYGICAGEE